MILFIIKFTVKFDVYRILNITVEHHDEDLINSFRLNCHGFTTIRRGSQEGNA